MFNNAARRSRRYRFSLIFFSFQSAVTALPVFLKIQDELDNETMGGILGLPVNGFFMYSVKLICLIFRNISFHGWFGFVSIELVVDCQC